MMPVKNNRSYLGAFLRGLLILFLLLMSLSVITSAISYFNKEDITKRLLNYLNGITYGDLQYKEIQISPLSLFPNISCSLEDVKFTYDQDSLINDPEILNIDKVHFGFNFIEMMSGVIKVKELMLEDGSIYLKQYQDNSLNIKEAIKPRSKNKDTNLKEDSMRQELSFALNEFSLKNIKITFDLASEDSMKVFTVNSSKLSLDNNKNYIECSLNTQLKLDQGMDISYLDLSDDLIEFRTKFKLDKSQNLLQIHEGKLNVRKAKLEVVGEVNLKSYEMDLNFRSSEKGLGLANEILTNKGVDNIKHGDIFLKGNVSGEAMKPIIDMSLEVVNLKIQMPRSKRYVDNLNVRGYYFSGFTSDQSDAVLTIDTLYATLPDGYIKSSFKYEDFSKPSLRYSIDINSGINNLDQIIEFGPVSNLRGEILLKDQFKGKKLDNEWIDRLNGQLSFKMDSLSFVLYDSIRLSNIDGLITGSVDSVNISDLNIDVQDSDLKLNGHINHFRDIFFPKGQDFKSKLQVSSNTLKVKSIEPYFPQLKRLSIAEINDMIFTVQLASNYKIGRQPDKVLDLECSIKGFKADLSHEALRLNISNDELVYQLSDSLKVFKVSNLLIEHDESSLLCNADFFDLGKDEMDSLLTRVAINNLDLNELGNLVSLDSATLSGKLDGSIDLYLRQPKNSQHLVSNFELNADSIFYWNDKDSLKLITLHLLASEIHFSDSMFLQNLDGQFKIEIDELKSSWINKPKLAYDITISDEIIEIEPIESSIYGKIGEGRYTLKPFDDPPKFSFDYSVKDLAIDDLVSTFYDQDTLPNKIKGLANLNLSIKTNGQSKEQLLHNLNGNIELKAREMTVYGFDIDRAIRKYERTQRFNLIDFGAFALTGPVGIAITKGNSYAGLFKIKKGDSTAINSLSSKWNLDGGRGTIKDVALATNENRIAGKGWIDFESDSLEFQIAAIDKNGCPIISQKIYGNRNSPELEKVKVIPTIMAPVTNLLSGIVGKDCETFYQGVIMHPEKTKRNKRK